MAEGAENGFDPPAAVGSDAADVLGVAVFNFGLCLTVPSWMNEKMGTVSVNKVTWGATLLALATFVALGLLGAAAVELPSADILSDLTSDRAPTLTRLAAFVFGIVILGLGIPVNCVVVKWAASRNSLA